MKKVLLPRALICGLCLLQIRFKTFSLDWKRSGLVVESLTRDRGAAGSSRTGVTVLCP